MNRRNLLRLLPMAPAAIATAAQETVSTAVAVSRSSFGLPGLMASNKIGGENSASAYDKARESLLSAMRGRQIPEWKLAEFRLTARRRAVVLDADLLSMRSLSPAARFAIQESRELERAIDEELAYDETSSGWHKFMRSFAT